MMYPLHLRLLLWCLLFVNTANLFGQIDAPVQMDIFPPGPTAASLGKFADIPMSYYSGTQNINVPIWNIKEGDIKVPISLSYHSGGIQVQELASWVGLGFALNAGGVVSRTIRGIPDDVPQGFMDPSNQPIPTSYPSDDSKYNTFHNYATDVVDSQADLFTFNFNGRTGKFQLDNHGNVYLQPYQKIKIQALPGTGLITGFRITTEDGFVYLFNVQENGKTYAQCLPNGSATDNSIYATSWFLSSITSPSGATVTFQYDTNFGFSYPIGIFEHYYTVMFYTSGYNSTPRKNTTCLSTQMIMQGARLKKISFSSGSVEFIATTPRADLVGDYALDQIVIKNDLGNVIRKFNFGYKFMSGSNIDYYTNTNVNNSVNYRLALVSLQETDASGISVKPPYEFTYDVGLPSRLSRGVDYWGFYNGQDGNVAFVTPFVGSDGIMQVGGNRNPDINFATKGTLTNIRYPTGGSSTFTYELHKADKGLQDVQTKSASLQTTASGNCISTSQPSTTNFTVNTGSSSPVIGYVDFTGFQCLQDDSAAPVPCDLYVSIYQLTSSGQTLIFTTSGKSKLNGTYLPVQLSSGNYQIYCPQLMTGCYHPFRFTVTWKEPTGNPDCTIGGLRLKRVEHYDPVTGKKVANNYSYIDNTTGRTSGKALTLPNYGYSIVDLQAPIQGVYDYMQYFVRTSTSNIPPGMTQGSFVGYSEVTEYLGENGSEIGYNGRTIYKYSHAGMYPDVIPTYNFPFPPVQSNDWKRGDLLEKTDYSKQGQNYVPVKKVSYQYVYYDSLNPNPNVQYCLGVKVGMPANMPNSMGINPITWSYFKFYTGYKVLASSTETLYDQADATKYSSKVTNYSYSVNHLELTTVEAIQSDDRKVVQYLSYPPDYADVSGFIQDMKAANIIQAPIEKVTYKTESDGSNVRILSGEITTYKTGGKGLKDASYFLEAADPIPLGSFQFSNRGTAGILPPTGTASNFSVNSNVYSKRVTYDAYDGKGNILQYTKDGFITSILWGYNNNFPVVRADNASRSTDITVASQIAYTGFEMGPASTEYGWQNVNTANYIDRSIDPTNVFAGRYAYKMLPGTSSAAYMGPTFYLTPPSPQKGKYKISCRIKTPSNYTANKASLVMYTFAKGSCCTASPVNAFNNQSLGIPATNNAWQYFELVLDFNSLRQASGSTDLTIACYATNGDLTYSVYIDEIRIAPADAQVTSYTYDPQIGTSSETIPNGTATFYEYDSLGRLKNVKNQDGNILNSYSYIYRNQ